jgi:hypothetical protein
MNHDLPLTKISHVFQPVLCQDTPTVSLLSTRVQLIAYVANSGMQFCHLILQTLYLADILIDYRLNRLAACRWMMQSGLDPGAIKKLANKNVYVLYFAHQSHIHRTYVRVMLLHAFYIKELFG